MKKRMKIGVDTGEIVDWLVNTPTEKSIPIKKGKYKIKLFVSNCWNGATTNYDFLDVKKDSFIALSDGFALNKSETKFAAVNNSHKRGCVVSTVGDGSFFVNVEITKIKRITYDPYRVLLSEAKQFFKNNKFSDETVKEYSDKFLRNASSEQLNKVVRSQQQKETRKLLNQCNNLIRKPNLIKS